MGQIQSSAGLITGLNITQTVNNLMQADSQPVTQLTNEDTQLQQPGDGVLAIVRRTVGPAKRRHIPPTKQPLHGNLGDQQQLLGAVSHGDGDPGGRHVHVYSVAGRAIAAVAQQRFSEPNHRSGRRKITFRYGANLNQSASLDSLNGRRRLYPRQNRRSPTATGPRPRSTFLRPDRRRRAQRHQQQRRGQRHGGGRRRQDRLDRPYRPDGPDGVEPEGAGSRQRQHGGLARAGRHQRRRLLGHRSGHPQPQRKHESSAR